MTKQVLLAIGLSTIVTLLCSFSTTAQVIINEVLADPPPGVDVNGDGTASTTQDEFVELYNNAGVELDLSAWTLADGNSVRHTIPSGTLVPDQGTLVVFSGGTPTGTFGNSLVQTASTGALGLNNGGDELTLADATGNVVATLSYGSEGGNDQSLTRDPDGSVEPPVLHTTVSEVAFSPGTRTDGTNFPGNKEVTEEVIRTTIAGARDLPDGTRVEVEGVLTVTDQLGGPAYLQDSTGGIAVFDSDLHANEAFAVGDQLIVQATRTSFNDQLQLGEIDPADIERVLPATISITPRLVPLSELATYEGELVMVDDAAFPTPGDLLWPNSNFTLTDKSGTGELRIDSDVEELVGQVQPTSCSVTGVVGSFRGTPQLLPRSAEDIPCTTSFVPPTDTSSIPLSQTLDVVTWNIEWFGSTGNGPSPEATQRDSVRSVLAALDADLYALQEIADSAALAELVATLPGYALLIQTEFVSQPPNQPGESQKVAFVYKSAVVNPVQTQGLLADLHPLYNGGDDGLLPDYPVEDRTRFYASGRLPYLLEADVTIDNVTERINFINLHARANSSNGPEDRYAMRRYDVEVLKNYIDSTLAEANVILLGDYNDDVDETVANVSTTTSSYVAYTNDNAADATDNQFYQVVTASLSEAGRRSFVSRENMIDHIAVTDELIDEVLPNSATVHYEFVSSTYENTTSDHIPVSARLRFADTNEPDTTITGLPPKPFGRPLRIRVYPIPIRDQFTLRFTAAYADEVMIRIRDIWGRLRYVNRVSLRPGVQEIHLDADALHLARGIYVLRAQGRRLRSRPVRLIVR